MKFRFPHWAFSIGCAMLLLHPLRAHAALPSGGSYLTTSQLHDIIGDTVTGRYYNGSQYVDITYRYQGSSTVGALQQHDSSDIVQTSKPFIYYSASISGVNTSPDFITFDLYPEFSIQNTEYIYSFIAHNMTSGISASVYSPPRWEWYLNGRTTVFQDSNLLNPNQTEYAHFQANLLNSNRWFTYAECNYSSNVATSGYSVRASFFGFNPLDVAVLAIGCPYISTGGFGQSGTLAPVTGTSVSTSSSVDVDLTETNSLLGSIRQGIENLANSILNGLKNLFIPSETFMTEWKDDMSDELEDHLGGIYEATDILHDWAAQFRNVQASSEIYVPAVTVPLAGVSWTVGDWHVPLKPSGMPALVYDGFALIVDFLALAAFLNMCHKKLEVVLVPESEKVD